MALTRYKVAKPIGVAQRRIDEICAGQRAMSADTAVRPGWLFGMDALIWMSLQAQHGLEVAKRGLRRLLDLEVTPLGVADWVCEGFGALRTQ